MDCPKSSGVGDRRFSRVGTKEPCAPEVDWEPISSWLKSVMQFTFPSRVGKSWSEAVLARASTAAKLKMLLDRGIVNRNGVLTKRTGCPDED